MKELILGGMIRKFSWMLLVLLVFVGCGEDDDEDECCGPPPTLTAIPPSGSQVAANATITLVFDYPVESVTGATWHGGNWTIPVAAALSITWTNKDGSRGGPVLLTYVLKSPDRTPPKISGGTE